MKATKESTRLQDQILPPRMEDAGLEDFALPTDLSKKPFLILRGVAQLVRL
jgi:hypothetical protein